MCEVKVKQTSCSCHLHSPPPPPPLPVDIKLELSSPTLFTHRTNARFFLDVVAIFPHLNCMHSLTTSNIRYMATTYSISQKKLMSMPAHTPVPVVDEQT